MTFDSERRRVLRLLAGIPLLPGTFALGCSNKSAGAGPVAAGPDGTAAAAAAAAAPGAASAPGPAPAGVPWAGKFPQYDLIDRLGFGMLQRGGLWIDFGTTDAFKYTFGGWLTGWGAPREREGVRFAHALGAKSIVFVPWDRSEDLIVRVRAARAGATGCDAYFGGKQIGVIEMPSDGWRVATLRIPASRVRRGENEFLVRWRGEPRMVDGEAAAAAVDWIHVAPADAAGQAADEPTTQQSVQGSAKVGAGNLRALRLAPGTRISFPVDVPEDGPVLGMMVGAAAAGGAAGRLTVSAVGDGDAPRTLADEAVGGGPAGPLRPLAVDLAPVAGRVVRLDIEYAAAGAGAPPVLLAGPAVFVAPERSEVEVLAHLGRTHADNAILLMIDTLRADHVPPYGPTPVQAPALQALADRGTLFERFSAVEDWTKPSCATMLTGLYPCTHRTQTEDARLPASVAMVSEEMKRRGVGTAAFIANGYVSDKFGFARGWDSYTNYIREGKRTAAQNVFADALKWIEAHKSERFYAYVHTIDPHVPYSPPHDYLRMYYEGAYAGPIEPRKTHLQIEEIKSGAMRVGDDDKAYVKALYAGEISYHDAHMSAFFQRLGELGLLDRTVVAVTSDHGEEFWDRGSVGHGHSIFQELIHVPFLLMWKGVVPAGRRVADNHDHAAIVPTFFDAMGLEPPDYLEGTSILPRALGRQEPGPHGGFSTHQGQRMAVWSGRHKLQLNGLGRRALFDLVEDPRCEKDLDDERLVTVSYMRGLLGHFLGAPDRRAWRDASLARANVAAAAAEDAEMDTATRQQLEELGYLRPGG